MAEVNTHAGNIRLVGGRLGLDFVNTVACYDIDQPKDYLRSYTDLVLWSWHVGILTDQVSQQLRQEATRRPADAALVFTRAIALRQALYQVFSAFIDGQAPLAADLSVLNATLAAAPIRSRIVPAAQGCVWNWSVDANALDQVLWPIAWSAADLLTSTDVSRVRRCAGDGCTWLFLDTSHNRSRRWCFMQDCGNRAKARRHYARHRSTSTST